jgi:hypothetical protein
LEFIRLLQRAKPAVAGRGQRRVIRGLLAEFCLVFAQSPKALRAVLADVIEYAGYADRPHTDCRGMRWRSFSMARKRSNSSMLCLAFA